ncbi:MAG TPA: tyrosine-type recombinase/integrase [Rhizomicrobium sp.]|nr:tyrosine-type recombinase/integrase [Rhizomicrobium sp.]
MEQGYYEGAHRLKDGAILVYIRPGAKKTNYQARLKVPGVTGYITRALKTRDLNTAIAEAEDLFHQLKAEQRLGLDVKIAGNLKFKELWKRFYAAHEAGLSVHRQRLHRLFATKYFTPYFGEERVSDMPDAFVERYWDWRINYHNPENWDDPEDIPFNAARIPAQKTLDMEAGMLRQIFRWGKRVGYVKREPWIKPTKVKHTKGVERRPTFTEGEWKQVYTYLREWVKEPMVSTAAKGGGSLHRKGPHALHRFQRELLRDYVLFMANSGFRPNEARQLRWRDVRTIKDADKKTVLVADVAEATKTGARAVVCRDGTHIYIERLRKVSVHTAPDDLVFGNHDGKAVENFGKTFQAVLSKLTLLNDGQGKRRTVYSLRHFYCTQSLLSGVPIHTLARNMGTSISYIEQHYSHVLTVMQAKELRTKKFNAR